jgi:hypothetical protein
MVLQVSVDAILDQPPATSLESQHLKFKSWGKDDRELSHEIADAVHGTGRRITP